MLCENRISLYSPLIFLPLVVPLFDCRRWDSKLHSLPVFFFGPILLGPALICFCTVFAFSPVPSFVSFFFFLATVLERCQFRLQFSSYIFSFPPSFVPVMRNLHCSIQHGVQAAKPLSPSQFGRFSPLPPLPAKFPSAPSLSLWHLRDSRTSHFCSGARVNT